MTPAVSTAAAGLVPARVAEVGSQPESAEGMDFASLLGGLADNPNSGGEGEVETGSPESRESAADKETTAAAVPDALALANLAQLWLPPTPKPLPETPPPSLERGSEVVAMETTGQPAPTAAVFLPEPGRADLLVGLPVSTDAAAAQQRGPTGALALERGGWQAVGPRLFGEGRAAGEQPGEASPLTESANWVAPISNPVEAMEFADATAAAPLRPFLPLGLEDPPVNSSAGRSLPTATVVASNATAVSSQQVSLDSRSATETRPPLTRRFTSAAEMMFTTVAEPEELTLMVAPVPAAGTGTAEQGDTMKQGTDQKQFAEPGVQTLPLELAAAAPVRRGGARSVPEDGGLMEASVDTTSIFGSLLPLPTAGYLGLDGFGDLPTLNAASAVSVPELTQAGMLRHVTELRYSGATELAVVLQPDADTQLALRLTFNSNGEVSVQARCEQGDAQALAANWGDIRDALAQQGVRLGALELAPELKPENLTPRTGNGGPSPDGQPSSQRHGQPWPETLDDLPLVGSQTEAPSRRSTQRLPVGRGRSWESWA